MSCLIGSLVIWLGPGALRFSLRRAEIVSSSVIGVVRGDALSSIARSMVCAGVIRWWCSLHQSSIFILWSMICGAGGFVV